MESCVLHVPTSTTSQLATECQILYGNEVQQQQQQVQPEPDPTPTDFRLQEV
jgi:hypothetical protein